MGFAGAVGRVGEAGGEGGCDLLWFAGAAERGGATDDSDDCCADSVTMRAGFRCEFAPAVLLERGDSGVAGVGDGDEDERCRGAAGAGAAGDAGGERGAAGTSACGGGTASGRVP